MTANKTHLNSTPFQQPQHPTINFSHGIQGNDETTPQCQHTRLPINKNCDKQRTHVPYPSPSFHTCCHSTAHPFSSTTEHLTPGPVTESHPSLHSPPSHLSPGLWLHTGLMPFLNPRQTPQNAAALATAPSVPARPACHMVGPLSLPEAVRAQNPAAISGALPTAPSASAQSAGQASCITSWQAQQHNPAPSTPAWPAGRLPHKIEPKERFCSSHSPCTTCRASHLALSTQKVHPIIQQASHGKRRRTSSTLNPCTPSIPARLHASHRGKGSNTIKRSAPLHSLQAGPYALLAGAFLGVAFFARLAGPSILVPALRLGSFSGVNSGLAFCGACREECRVSEIYQQQTNRRLCLAWRRGLKGRCLMLHVGCSTCIPVR